MEANSTISTLTSKLETAQAKNRSDSETIKSQQIKIENVLSKCSAYKVSTKKCQDEASEKEKEIQKERHDAGIVCLECCLFQIALINLSIYIFRIAWAAEMDVMRQQVTSIIDHKSSTQSNILPPENQEMSN